MDHAGSTVRISLTTTSAGQSRELARELATATRLPAVAGLVGPLGAGKTEFVKGLGWGLGLDPKTICSATFVIICEYGTSHPLIHVDAYRLVGPGQWDALGADELLERTDALIAVEWADRVRDRLPADTLWVRQELAGPTDRRITLQTTATSPWAGGLERLGP